MKKIVLLLSMILIFSGCSVNRIDNASLDKVISVSIKEKVSTRNAVGKGYKYYLPKGVIRRNIDDFNEKLYCNDDVYYLFIDVVSYLNKVEVKGSKEENSYYYEDLDKGYISITKENNKYLVKLYYNYSYIESYVKKENINEAVSNMLFILKSVKFEKNILTSGSSDEIVNNYEETYSIKQTDNEKKDFLEYEELYGKYTGPDIEKILEEQEKQATNLETDIITKDKIEE